MFGSTRGVAGGRGLAAFAIAVVTGGCQILGPQACTLVLEPGLSVEVLDSVTGEPLRGDLRVIARAGSFADTVDTETYNLPPSTDRDSVTFSPIHLAHEQPGTYQVLVEAPDHAPWQRQGVRVEEGSCHVRTVELTARLQPS